MGCDNDVARAEVVNLVGTADETESTATKTGRRGNLPVFYPEGFHDSGLELFPSIGPDPLDRLSTGIRLGLAVEDRSKSLDRQMPAPSGPEGGNPLDSLLGDCQ